MKWDRTRPRIYDPRRGESTISVPASPVNESTARPPQKNAIKNNKNKKRKRKSRSESVWCIPGGLPDTNRRRH
jgi:hypothetical protein